MEGERVSDDNRIDSIRAQLSAYRELEDAARNQTKCPCGPHMLALAAALARLEEARKEKP